jgi:ketosteroid isomerase-like protein
VRSLGISALQGGEVQTYGTYAPPPPSAIGKDGKSVVEHGKYTSIWKKQKDGGWKVVLDMGNASPDAAH